MPDRLTPAVVYCQRIEDMAARLVRFNLLFEAETRADIVYIQRYAAETRRLIELTLRDRDKP